MTGRARLVRWYPPAWRARYGDDLAAYLDDMYAGRLPLPAAASLVAGGLREWVRFARAGQTALPAAVRVRAGVLMVFAGWAAFVVAGSSFAKISEHLSTSLSATGHAVPDVSYTVVQDVATVSGLMVVVGVVLAVPACAAFLSNGGWPVIRRHVLRATVATALAAATTIAVASWAHQLSSPQRNGGNVGYAALFVVWAGLLAWTTALWTVAAIATALRLTLPRRLLLAEAALATAVTAGMLIMVVGTAVWWAVVASSAPSFLGGASGPTSGWPPQLVGTLALMVAALASATAGVRRIAQAVHAV